MTHRSHSSAARSEDATYFTGKPIFLPGWWKGLRVSQRCLLSAFLLFDVLGTVLFCASITDDRYFEHTMTLVGIKPKGYPDQAVPYNLSIRTEVGFWSNMANQHTENRFDTQQPEVLRMLQRHINVSLELWEFCATRAHRASACGHAAFVLITLGLTGLFSSYFVAIFNRKLMINLSMASPIILLASFALIYAASLEYNNCIISRQVRFTNEQQFQFFSFKGRYFAPQLKPNYQPLVGVLVAYAFGFVPMTGTGLILALQNSENL
ncbi:hypothetical protein PHET_07746 [Paragonimus heterotremus]|uniref:Uncharacterized protein n=1 Tax=Paragonimus heterotremus TaxID=100268 RepID=A0A8J4SX92_9TREM|nr:hypothetical protein PHET_07746 [Paragonimus heterotremus]